VADFALTWPDRDGRESDFQRATSSFEPYFPCSPLWRATFPDLSAVRKQVFFIYFTFFFVPDSRRIPGIFSTRAAACALRAGDF
jgi:hypothetical protein